MTAAPEGIVPATKPAAGRLGFRIWMDSLQTVFHSGPGDDFFLVGAEEAITIPRTDVPPRIGAPIPTLLRNDDSVFTQIEQHGLPTPRSWAWAD
ncbi:hypothetical protein [Nonomuraea sp. KM88]|uniref:hypothetical protein n=1 Tax=Nonomuraea sp. KM88 TaxID=3457427 RepID=UPI003FCE657A